MEYPCPLWNVNVLIYFQVGRFRDFQSASYCFFFCVESALPGLPLFWDSKDVLLCHNKHVHCQKEMFRIPFQAKTLRVHVLVRKGRKFTGICLVCNAYHTPWNWQFIPKNRPFALKGHFFFFQALEFSVDFFRQFFRHPMSFELVAQSHVAMFRDGIFHLGICWTYFWKSFELVEHIDLS